MATSIYRQQRIKNTSDPRTPRPSQASRAASKMGIVANTYDPWEDEVPLNKRIKPTLQADAPRLSSGNNLLQTRAVSDREIPMYERTEPTRPDDAPKLLDSYNSTIITQAPKPVVPMSRMTDPTFKKDMASLQPMSRMTDPTFKKEAFTREAMSERTEPTRPDDAPRLYTHDGYPARQNPDGSHSTEVSITVTNPLLNNGAPTNIPSLWKGKEVDEKTAIKNAVASGNVYSKFPSIQEAVKSAVARSQAGGYTGPSGTGSVATSDPYKNEQSLSQRVTPTAKIQAMNAYERMIASRERGN